MSSNDSCHGPQWDLASEYPSPTAPSVEEDFQTFEALLEKMQSPSEALQKKFDVEHAQALRKLVDEATILLSNLSTFANCRLSVNSRDEEAQTLMGRLQGCRKRFMQIKEPLSCFCDEADEAAIDAFLADPQVSPWEFLVRHARKKSHERLPLPEENLINALAPDGIKAWGQLYDQLSSTIQCPIEVDGTTTTMGIAEASGLLQKDDETLRKNAWKGIGAGFGMHEETCAAALNAIAGWRLELNKKRSHQKAVHFLDSPTHLNRIDRDILDTLLSVTEAHRDLAQRAARLKARAMGKLALGPWDHRAPPPRLKGSVRDSGIPYQRAIETIACAYGEVDPAMEDFVRMMHERNWVEGSVGPSKRPGAYCTRFAKSKTPRVYMTYTGGPSNVITLAHELGHAFHGWVMRDLPDAQRSYGMSLAETASTFGEALVRDAMLAQADSPKTKFDILWAEISALVTFMLNIPTRFTFEKSFYEARQERPLRPAEIKNLMNQAWKYWYGETCPESDPMFWASKLHFYIADLSFYNFPYLFGYLFSLGIYAKRNDFGEDFFPRYRALLQDTGRMTAADLARKHLEVDLYKPLFWQETLHALEKRVDAFENFLGEEKINLPT